MSALHWNTVTPEMRAVMKGFAGSALSKEFYLAGGSALALQLGHRSSIDLDFFSATQEDIPALIEPLRRASSIFRPSWPIAPGATLFFWQTMCASAFTATATH